MVKTEAALPIARHELEVEERHINQRTVSRYSPAIQTQNAPTLLGTLAAPNDSMCPSTSRGPNSHPNDHDQSRQFPVNGVTKVTNFNLIPLHLFNFHLCVGCIKKV